MSIKQDLDNELNKRVSDKQKEFDLVKETYEEDKFSYTEKEMFEELRDVFVGEVFKSKHYG